jgi:hypothetical protein
MYLVLPTGTVLRSACAPKESTSELWVNLNFGSLAPAGLYFTEMTTVRVYHEYLEYVRYRYLYGVLCISLTT